jgi:hypothetical protein
LGHDPSRAEEQIGPGLSDVGFRDRHTSLVTADGFLGYPAGLRLARIIERLGLDRIAAAHRRLRSASVEPEC